VGADSDKISNYASGEEETIMRETHVKLPTIGLIAGTRVALGIGIGLLLAERLTPEQRQAAG